MGLDMYISKFKKDEEVLSAFEIYGQKVVNGCWSCVHDIHFCDKLAGLYGDTTGIKNFLIDNDYSEGENILKYGLTISYWWKEFKENNIVPTLSDKLHCSPIEVDAINFVQGLIDVYQNSLSHLNRDVIDSILSMDLGKEIDEVFYWRKQWGVHQIIESVVAPEGLDNCNYALVTEEHFKELVEKDILPPERVEDLDFENYMYFYYLWY